MRRSSVAISSSLIVCALALFVMMGLAACKPGEVDPAKATLTELFAGTKKAHPPAPFAKVLPGMSLAQAFLMDQALMETSRDMPHWSPRKELSFKVAIDSRSVRNTRLRMSEKDAPQVVAAAWGAPMKGVDESSRREASYWFDAEAGLSAMMQNNDLGEAELTFQPYLAVGKLIGTSKEAFGFEKKPLLGATFDDLKSAYAAWESPSSPFDPKESMLSFFPPPTECGQTYVHASFGKDRKVESFTIKIGCVAMPSFKPEVLAAMKARLGEPKPGAVPDSYTWGTDPKIDMVDNVTSWEIEVRHP